MTSGADHLTFLKININKIEFFRLRFLKKNTWKLRLRMSYIRAISKSLNKNFAIFAIFSHFNIKKVKFPHRAKPKSATLITSPSPTKQFLVAKSR